MNNNSIDNVIKILQNKLHLTEFEKDILDSYYELSKSPIDREGIIKQIYINRKYNILVEEATLAETQTGGKVVSVSVDKLPNDQLIWNLKNQLYIMSSRIIIE